MKNYKNLNNLKQQKRQSINPGYHCLTLSRLGGGFIGILCLVFLPVDSSLLLQWTSNLCMTEKKTGK